jgi:hypothetical protein
MGQNADAYSLYGVVVDRAEWLDEQGEWWADGKVEAMKGGRLKFLCASPHYDCPLAVRVTVIGVDLDNLEPGEIIEAIKSTPALLKAAGLAGVPMLHTLLDVS